MRDMISMAMRYLLVHTLVHSGSTYVLKDLLIMIVYMLS